jgi:hypothetical protein
LTEGRNGNEGRFEDCDRRALTFLVSFVSFCKTAFAFRYSVDAMTSDNDSTFAAFLADLLGRIDRGEAIDRERLLAEHEELRPQLESFF